MAGEGVELNDDRRILFVRVESCYRSCRRCSQKLFMRTDSLADSEGQGVYMTFFFLEAAHHWQRQRRDASDDESPDIMTRGVTFYVYL